MTAYHRRKGSSFERLIADHFKAHGFPFADRRVKTGAKDRGDIGGVHAHELPVTIECKNYGGRLEPSSWIKEAQSEAKNDGSPVGIVIAKRRGTADPARQFVIMEVRDLVYLLTGMTQLDDKIEAAPEVLETLTEA